MDEPQHDVTIVSSTPGPLKAYTVQAKITQGSTALMEIIIKEHTQPRKEVAQEPQDDYMAEELEDDEEEDYLDQEESDEVENEVM